MVLRNKPGRVDGILELVPGIKEKGSIDFKEALSLRGKIAYCEGQTFGKLSAPLARILSRLASSPGPHQLSDELLLAMDATCSHLQLAIPRTVGPSSSESPIIIFLDGACEDITSVGAVMITPDGVCQAFGAVLEPELVASWKTKREQTQVIGQAELFPAIVCRLTWHHFLAGKKVVYFIDNEAARLGLVKSYSPILPSLDIIMTCIKWDFKFASTPWYARVPTICNLADGPSRMCLDTVPEHLGCSVVEPVFPSGCRPSKVLK